MIAKDRITLIAGPGGGGITGPDSSVHVIRVRAFDVRIEGLTVSGGRSGISIIRGGSADIVDNTISGTGFGGIIVGQNSYGLLTGNTVTATNGHSIFISLGAGADIYGNVVTGSGASGLVITRNGAAEVVGNAFSNNSAQGVFVMRGGFAEFSGDVSLGNEPNTVEGNGGPGILCHSNATVQFRAPQDFGTGNGGGNFVAFGGCVAGGSP